MIQWVLWLFFSCLLVSPCYAATTPQKIRTLYGSLNPKSISQHLAFYQLFPTSQEGRRALSRAWELLTGKAQVSSTQMPSPLMEPERLQGVVSVVLNPASSHPPVLSAADIQLINRLADHLHNRRLKGFRAGSEEEVLQLPSEQIDLARGLFLSQLGNGSEALQSIQQYEAVLDLMALQILAHLSPHASPLQKVQEINRFIFEEMNFRFPPHSVYAKDIDLYTFLPSVIDNRRGVCLGVSILYVCLAQRLGLDMVIIIPPGHIFVRYPAPDGDLNIETTLRGVHVDTEEYLSVDTRSLERCCVKETIGLAHMNHAAIFLTTGRYQEAIDAYIIAQRYFPRAHLQELRGYAEVMNGNTEGGGAMLLEIVDFLPEESVSRNPMAQDYLLGNADAESLQAIFMSVDEKRESLEKKRQCLADAVKKFPKYRSGWASLATTQLQMHRFAEALESLENYHTLDPLNPNIEYYLSAIYLERSDFNRSWDHLRQAEALTAARDHYPKVLKELRKALTMRCPE